MNFMTDLLRLSLTDPNAAGTQILSLRPNTGTALSALVVTIIITVVITYALNGFEPISLLPDQFGFPKILPITMVLVNCAMTLASVGSIWLVAHAFGGSGSLIDGVLIFAWFQVLQLLILILQIPLSVLPIKIALLAILITIVVLFWILFGLINSWMALNSMWKAAGCFIMGAFTLGIVGSFIFGSFGFSPEQVAL